MEVFSTDETSFSNTKKVWTEIQDFCSEPLSLISSDGFWKKEFYSTSIGKKL